MAHREMNATQLLLDNALTKRYPLGDATMKPASDPEHYVRIRKEVEEAPDRTFMQRIWKRISGSVRMR